MRKKMAVLSLSPPSGDGQDPTGVPTQEKRRRLSMRMNGVPTHGKRRRLSIRMRRERMKKVAVLSISLPQGDCQVPLVFLPIGREEGRV